MPTKITIVFLNAIAQSPITISCPDTSSPDVLLPLAVDSEEHYVIVRKQVAGSENWEAIAAFPRENVLTWTSDAAQVA